MSKLDELQKEYGSLGNRDFTGWQKDNFREGLKAITTKDVSSSDEGKSYIELLKKYREIIAEDDKHHGENYLERINSILIVGEDGLYSNTLRFIFELIQNVDDCEYESPDDCKLDMRFDFNENRIILTYNETGFTPFNVFAITGIAEAAKNISSVQNQIGEKGIGFKSVFGVSDKVLIRSGWFSFELYRDNFTIPIPSYENKEYFHGTQMTLFVARGNGGAKYIYDEVKKQYCDEEALFSKNPLLFLNKLTSLKMYFDECRCMEFHVSRSELSDEPGVHVEKEVEISVNLHGYDSDTGKDVDVTDKKIRCVRYSYPVVFSRKACQSRSGEQTEVGIPDGKKMVLRVIMPYPEYIKDVGNGALYSFLPTQQKLSVPLVCHVPFKLAGSREFVDPQGENLWFTEALRYLSELTDKAYDDWKTVVKEEIVRYLPGFSEYLFDIDKNNSKERCLRKDDFSGSHYLSLPLFLAVDGNYHRASDVFCFDQKEQIAEQEKVSSMMGFRNLLFVTSYPVSKLHLKTERDIKNRLFIRALSEPSVTAEILDYLDSAKYSYPDDLDEENLSFTAEQIEIFFRHPKLAGLLKSIGCRSINNNKQPPFMVKSLLLLKNIGDVLYDGFELAETPRKIEAYMKSCGSKCICLDIDDDAFLPCRNAVILSERSTQASFASLCYAIDKRDTFAIRIKLREASKQLDQSVESEEGTVADYLRNLGNVRRAIKDALGNDGYRSYIDLILKSGTDKGRFIQEILQNADDCDYPDGAVPSFSLIRKGNTVVTEYNETGFSRANVRAITAIGESTKKRLVDGNLKVIGEKGVGFKTIFAVAAEVRIYSGEYSFSLSDHEPTIPKMIKFPEDETYAGTRMEVVLRRPEPFPTYDEKTILKLCLCLRRLRSIKLGSHDVKIEDTDGQRLITIDGKEHIFERFTHVFTVTDELALEERRHGSRAISPEQTIICIVPNETDILKEYALYNGLPTKHRMKIPLVIDAPFALTTSREEIETDSSAWNDIVRRELYYAVMKVIDSLKEKERERIFRFMRFVHNGKSYENDISDCPYLNASSDFLSVLKSREILPTFDREAFEIPKRKVAYRYPEVANILFRKNKFADIRPLAVIDVKSPAYDMALNALECEKAPFKDVFAIVSNKDSNYAEQFIDEQAFRTELYKFLKNTPHEFKEPVKQLAIIPVFGKTEGSTEYISWMNGRIFVKPGTKVSAGNYYVLNENLLTKTDCEEIFSVNINEMNEEYERNQYEQQLKKILQTGDLEDIYCFIISAHQSGRLDRYDAFWALRGAEILPLKNGLGEIVDSASSPLFMCDHADYFPVKMIQSVIVNDECTGFARRINKFKDLKEIHPEDFHYQETLTADDVEMLMAPSEYNDEEPYFKNWQEILRYFYRAELLSDELIETYDLEFLTDRRIDAEETASYEFPSEPASDRNAIINHVRRQWQNPVKIVSVEVKRTVQRGQNQDGSTFDLDRDDARQGALRTYSPYEEPQLCFCQMCGKVKPQGLIEVNNIESLPKYFFPQLRIALCLDCSKHFKSLRNNQIIREKFLEAIKDAQIWDEGTVEIPIGHDDTIKFTGKHLAEVQEILKQMPGE